MKPRQTVGILRKQIGQYLEGDVALQPDRLYEFRLRVCVSALPDEAAR